MAFDGSGHSGAERARRRAFAAAARHSARVRWLRRFILIGAALISAGVIWYSYFRSLDIHGIHISLAKIGISGDKVTMSHPRLTGERRDGEPYEVTAVSGTQNPRDPTRITLNRLAARLRLNSGGDTRVVGDQGVYDSQKQTLVLSGNVHIKSVDFDLAMQSASMNFRTNVFQSPHPVRLDFTGGWIKAKSMAMAKGGEQITFIGHVESQFEPRAAGKGAKVGKEN